MIEKVVLKLKVFAISDLHMSVNNPKPMDIFGPSWTNYLDKIFDDWKTRVTDDDVVLLSGDLSWAMKLEDAVADIKMLEELPGKKIIIKGNHDYWWSTISKVRNILPKNIFALQNDCIKIENIIFCGTRGWMICDSATNENKSQDEKIFDREVIRLELSLKQAKAMKNDGDKIICMMHYPPFDKNGRDTKFTKLISDYDVSAVVYGHLHGKDINVLKEKTLGEINYFLTSCDQVDNKLVEIV